MLSLLKLFLVGACLLLGQEVPRLCGGGCDDEGTVHVAMNAHPDDGVGASHTDPDCDCGCHASSTAVSQLGDPPSLPPLAPDLPAGLASEFAPEGPASRIEHPPQLG